MHYSRKELHPAFPKSQTSCIVTWGSLEDYLTDCDELPRYRHAKPETMKMRRGDPKIIEKMEKFHTQLNTSEYINTRKRAWDISSGTLDIPTFLGGTPEYFSRIEYQRGRDVRIVFSPEVHVTSDSDAIYLRGAAILSLVDSLESLGNRVELWLGWDNTIGGEKYESRILAKTSGELLNLASLATVCCDASFLRTCEFNLIGHFLRTPIVGCNTGITLQGDVVISGRYDEMNHFDSIESCKLWINQIKSKLASGQGDIQ